MSSSTSGTSSGDSNRSPGVTRKPATIKPKAGTKPGEEGRYTLPSGGTIKTTEMDPDKLAAKRQERAAAISERGGGVKAEADYERESSIAELKGRLESQLPGVLGAIGRFSLERQLEALEKGATPVKIERPDGDFLTVGVVTAEGKYTGRPEYGDIAREAQRGGAKGPFIETSLQEVQKRQAEIRAQEGPEPEPAPAPAPAPPAAQPVAAQPVLMGEAELGRGRRTKRSGAAGTLLEGGGILYD